MKKLFFTVLGLFLLVTTFAQPVRKEVVLPNLPGYETLKCDFHMHTVFSDGSVWPTVRVEEAWVEGLDAISITDHLEYTPKKEYLPVNHNAPYAIAQRAAEQAGLILIKGTEVTKSMPPGHFNALFVKDAEKIFNTDYKAALREAKNQGAYIIWNHPGWIAQAPNGAKWMDAHQELYEEKLFSAIEVVNHNEWYPEALDWAISKNLTVMSNSDVHDPVPAYLAREGMAHRPITLVFAKERTAEAIREALEAGRTLGWLNDLVFGKEEWLTQLFSACVTTSKPFSSSDKNINVKLTNLSDLPFELINKEKESQVVQLPAHSSVMLTLPKEAPARVYKVKNLFSGSASNLEVTIRPAK